MHVLVCLHIILVANFYQDLLGVRQWWCFQQSICTLMDLRCLPASILHSCPILTWCVIAFKATQSALFPCVKRFGPSLIYGFVRNNCSHEHVDARTGNNVKASLLLPENNLTMTSTHLNLCFQNLYCLWFWHVIQPFRFFSLLNECRLSKETLLKLRQVHFQIIHRQQRNLQEFRYFVFHFVGICCKSESLIHFSKLSATKFCY
jgi:hypothetical protein